MTTLLSNPPEENTYKQKVCVSNFIRVFPIDRVWLKYFLISGFLLYERNKHEKLQVNRSGSFEVAGRFFLTYI